MAASVAVCTLLFTATSCKKDNAPSGPDATEVATATQVVINNEIAIQPYSESFGIVLDQSSELSASLIRTGNGSILRPGNSLDNKCYETTITPADVYQFPKTVTRNFGDGCKGADGKLRSGKIISVFSDLFYVEGATVTTTFENYQVDSFAVSGTMTIKNAFSNVPDTTYAIKVNIADATVSSVATGFWRKVNADLTFTQVKVSPNYYSPLQPYGTTGVINGENSIGIKWTSEVTKPVIRKISCQWPVSGTVTYQWNSNADKATVDYGDGDCDNKAAFSYKGFSKSIDL